MPTRYLLGGLLTGLAVWLSGCTSLPSGRAPEEAAQPAQPNGTTGPSRGTAVKLSPPVTPKNWQEARAQAARRLVAANPDQTYMGKPPDILMAIPVLTIELNADGSIRDIEVMRYPSQARDTVELAKAAVRRAAPFGDVSRLPKPWKFNETFLFDEDRKFKPMTLDQR